MSQRNQRNQRETKTKTKIAYCLLCCALLLGGATMCVAQPRIETAIRGGASMLTYKTDYGRMQPSYNLGVDLFYTQRFKNGVAMRLGAAMDYSQCKFVMESNYTDSYTVVDTRSQDRPTGETMVIDYKIGSLLETDNQLYVSVPLQVGYYYKALGVFFGPKIALPMVARYKQNPKNTTFRMDGMPLNTDAEPVVQGELLNPSLKRGSVDVWVSLDANYYIDISQHVSIGVGAYIDCALPIYKTGAAYNNEAIDRNSLLWLDESDPVQRHSTSVLQAFNLQAATPEQPAVALVRSFNYLSCGIRLAVQIGGDWNYRLGRLHSHNQGCHCMPHN